MDKKYLVIFIIISLIILCKDSRKEKFTTSGSTASQIEAIGNISNWLSTNSCNLDRVGIPDGTIVMWSGAKSNIPAYWHICDGNGGTPNLTNKFILGADHTKTDGDSRLNNNSPDKKLTKEMIPEMTTVSSGIHKHNYMKTTEGGSHTAKNDLVSKKAINVLKETSTATTDAGAHTHTVGTAAASQLNIPIPRHHSLYFIMKISEYTDAGEIVDAPGPATCGTYPS